MDLHHNQGKPVPPSVGVGAWIFDPALYLDTSDPASAPVGPAGEIAGAASPGAVVPVGLPAARIASTFGISVDELVRLNAAGELRIKNWAVPARSATSHAMRFRVEHGADKWFEITTERSPL